MSLLTCSSKERNCVLKKRRHHQPTIYKKLQLEKIIEEKHKLIERLTSAPLTVKQKQTQQSEAKHLDHPSSNVLKSQTKTKKT